MDKNAEKRLDSQITAEVGEGMSELDEVLNSKRVAEVVGEKASEDGGTAIPVKRRKTGFAAISHRVSDLIFSSRGKKVHLPSVALQKKEVRISLEKEIRQLVKKVKKIESQRHFSASALEKTIAQIRYLKKLLAGLVSIAAKKLEILYRQYVLKRG